MKMHWKLWIAIISLAFAEGSNAGTITREYIEHKMCGDQLSFEMCRESLLLQLRRRFAEEVVGAYVQSNSQSSLAGRDESVQQQIRSTTMARATLRIENDDMHQQFYESGGVLTISVRMSIDEQTVNRFQQKLDIQKLVERKQSEITHLQTSRDYQFTTQSNNRNGDRKKEESEAIYVLGGTSDLAEYGNKGGFTGVIGLHENGDKELALDLFLMMSGSLETTKGDRISTVSINFAMKYVALNAKFVRLAFGGGVGLVGLIQDEGANEYDTSGAQLLGLADLTVFRRTVRMMGRVMLKQTGFDREENYVPILEENESPASGLFYMVGLEIDL